MSPCWLDTRNSEAAIPCSSECASAPKTSMLYKDRTPATRLKVPGLSGLTTVTRSGCVRIAISPLAISSSTDASGKSRHITSVMSPPPNTCRARSTRSATSSAFQSLHADGPVANESACVSACKRSKTTVDCKCPATMVMVASSDKSRRVAVSASNKWCSINKLMMR